MQNRADRRQMFTAAIGEAAATLPESLRGDARLVFTAHSIPLRAANRCGPDLYGRQVGYAADLVATCAGYPEYDQVWQSRSGPPQVPWLEPDVAEHLSALAETGVKAVIVCPLGFVADHIEVVWDLDNELQDRADELGIAYARASTPNSQRRFAQLILDLVDEMRDGREPARVTGARAGAGYGTSVNGKFCTRRVPARLTLRHLTSLSVCRSNLCLPMSRWVTSCSRA